MEGKKAPLAALFLSQVHSSVSLVLVVINLKHLHGKVHVK